MSSAKSANPIAEALAAGIEFEWVYNREGNVLPFGLYNPETEGKLVWICGRDEEERITSVYSFDKDRERSCAYLESEAQAIAVRDELLRNNWLPIKEPKVEFSVENEDGTTRPLNRRERRALAKKHSDK